MITREIDLIPGAMLVALDVHQDERGFFAELFREDRFSTSFVQGNHSRSRAGVLRGLHFHRKQSDAWYVINGHAQAMLADLRVQTEKPPVASVDLQAEDPHILFIPPGVAHGFLAITDVDLIYWVTHYYDSTDEFGVAWNDPTLSPPWKNRHPILSERDKNNALLEWSSISLS